MSLSTTGSSASPRAAAKQRPARAVFPHDQALRAAARVRAARCGVGAAARRHVRRQSWRRRRPPRRSARDPTSSRAATTSGSGPSAAAARCHACRSESPERRRHPPAPGVPGAVARRSLPGRRPSARAGGAPSPVGLDDDEPGGRGCLERILAEAERRRGTAYDGELAGVVRGREQQQRLHRSGQQPAALEECLLHTGAEVQLFGSGVDPPSWSGLSPVGSSSRASGLPPLAAISRSVTSGAAPGRWSRSSRAAAGSSPRSCSSGMPSGRNGVAASSRAENTRSTRSAPSRRAQNTSASAVAESSQCASSTTHSTVFSSAAVVSRDNVATATRKGSTGGPSSSPNTTRRARACGPGSPSRSRFNGSSSRCRAAKASGASTSSPWVRRTVTSPASVTSASSSADLPTPGSPCTTRLAEPPCRACWSSSFRCAVSRSRPTSTQ